MSPGDPDMRSKESGVLFRKEETCRWREGRQQANFPYTCFHYVLQAPGSPSWKASQMKHLRAKITRIQTQRIQVLSRDMDDMGKCSFYCRAWSLSQVIYEGCGVWLGMFSKLSGLGD